MKKLFFVSCAVFAMASVSSAAVIQCTPTSQNVVSDGVLGGPQVFNCGPLGTADGFNVTDLTIFQTATASVTGQHAGTLYGLTFNMSNSGGFTNDPAFDRTCVASNLTGSCTVGGDSAGGFTDIADVDVVGPFTVTVTASNIVGGTIVSTTGGPTPNATANAGLTSVFVFYNEVSTQTGVPEPSTFMLLGTALTGLGALARRRKK